MLEPVISPTLPFSLRPYQQEAVARFLTARKGIVVMPTGSGKTAVAIKAMSHIGAKTAVLVPTIVLMNQWVEKLREAGVRATRFYGAEKRLGRVTVFVFNSAVRHLNALKPFSFLVVDEVHHLASKTLRSLLEVAERKPYALGLTSCIQRGDYEDWRIRRVMPVIYRMRIREARKNGFVSPLQVIEAPVRMTPYEAQKYDAYTSTIRNAIAYFKSIGVNTIADIAKLNHPMARACLSALARRKGLLSNIAAKKKRVWQIIEIHRGEKVLLFSESIQSLEAIRRYLTTKGVPCGIYHSEMPLQKRRRALKQWKQGRFNALLSARCLEEGTDVPSCRIGVIIGSGTSKRQFIQRIGRMMRPHGGRPGKIYVVYAAGTIEAGFSGRIRHLLKTE